MNVRPLPRPGRGLAAGLVALMLVVSACGDDAGSEAADTSVATDPSAADPVATTTAPDPGDVSPTGESLSYTIPAGTGDKIDAGEAVEVLPARLDVRLGDHITIDNQDGRNHVIGPFYVPAGDVMEHTFVAAGEFAGACSAHASGEIVVVVT
jgi:plastocyanin